MVSIQKQIQNELSVIFQSFTTKGEELLAEEDVQHLPAPVRKWMHMSGAIGKPKVKSVWLEQKFLMKLKPGQKKWYNAVARQVFTIENPAFIWAVRMEISPLLKVTGRDRFIEGKGEVQMKLNGLINLGKNSGAKIDEGTLQRYLGETVWFPSALTSRHIKWEALDALSAKATMTFNGTRGSGTFHFSKEGYFDKFTAMRYKDNTTDARRMEWIITATDYAEMNGIRIPVMLEAAWKLDTGRWTWCNLEVTHIKYNLAKPPQKLI